VFNNPREDVMATAASVSQADVDALARAIAAVKSDMAPTPLGGQSPIKVFCDNWPNLRTILQTIQPVVSHIPGVGPVISGVISSLLLLGNGAFAALCGGH
jgi:hypothetical protein